MQEGEGEGEEGCKQLNQSAISNQLSGNEGNKDEVINPTHSRSIACISSIKG